MIQAGRYRKKPVVIDAVQWDGTEACMKVVLELVDFDKLPSDGIHVNNGLGYGPTEGTLDIPTLEGVMTASPGDWIIRGVKGEIYPCKPDIFEATYEPEVTGDFITIGPECFTDKDQNVICYKGENYYRAGEMP